MHTPDFQPYGRFGYTHDEALDAGISLAVDTLKLRPRNIAGLNPDQMRVVKVSVAVAEEAGGEAAKDVLRALGATQLRHL